ncbi:MAG TPA: RNA polymerase sigma factor [Vicinamibacteria bacterium]
MLEDDDCEDLVALMTSYQAGQVRAFERLYALLAPSLFRYFESRSAHVASDLVQETFLQIHRSRHTYTPPLPVQPWVFGVARNVERRHWRRSRRQEGRLLDLEGMDRTAVALGARASSRVDLGDLEDVVRRLPASGRDAWLLHHMHGFSFPEIGARLRIEAGAARLRAHRTMSAIRELLGIARRKRND